MVVSQIIRSVGYDVESGRLEVEFTNGWMYEYEDVPASLYRSLMSAESHGRFLHKHIRDQFVTRRTR